MTEVKQKWIKSGIYIPITEGPNEYNRAHSRKDMRKTDCLFTNMCCWVATGSCTATASCTVWCMTLVLQAALSWLGCPKKVPNP